MNLASGMKAASEHLIRESSTIAEAYRTHNASAGSQREALAIEFLSKHLPKKFCITSGFAFGSDGSGSGQSDILIVDGMNNAALHASEREKLWPVEAVYAVIEVKTVLDRKALSDSTQKCVKFKSIPREFSSICRPAIEDSLFCVFSFSGPKFDTILGNLSDDLSKLESRERPDLIIVLDKGVIASGSYFELINYGQVGSELRKKRDRHSVLPGYDYVETPHSLAFWFAWLNSWLSNAGNRIADPVKYMSVEAHSGRLGTVRV